MVIGVGGFGSEGGGSFFLEKKAQKRPVNEGDFGLRGGLGAGCARG